MDKIIIFGSGQIGHEALAFLGNDNVTCFCDNALKLAGKEKYGKMVISFDDLKETYSEAIIIIAVAGFNAYAIAEQCEENGILDYLIYTYMRKTFPEFDRIGLFRFIRDPLNRMRVRKDIYYKRAAELKEQINYLKRHVDIRHLKPASGELRYRQKQCVHTSSIFFKKIEKLEIKPILYGGNLLGYIRHNGFIPWDDDIDFALIREEYERLKEYCRQHIYTEEEWYNKQEICEKDFLPGLERYYWHLWHDHFSVVEVREDSYMVGMDFFPLEYYAEHYSLVELRKLVAQMRDEVVCKNSEEEKIQCVKRTLENNKANTAKKSGHIYFGLDSSEIRHSYHREHFIPESVVFPLREVLWEGEKYWVPNDAEEFLTYEYENCWNFPEDVGIPLHHRWLEEEI
ncbi:MAG: LicD family protein [Lachnospiraceae bacterium]|nr:LicD family protein [Lachnospiraceae bacterium]